jgi:hypothetical protein
VSTVNPAGGGNDYRHELENVKDGLVNVVESKVKASTTAATLTTVVIAALGLYVFKGNVPDWVTLVIETAVTGALTFLAGWWAKHTHRAPTVTEVPPITSVDPPDGGVNQRGS